MKPETQSMYSKGSTAVTKKKNIEALVKEPYFTWADLDPNYQSSKTDGRAQFGGIFEKTNISWVLEGLGMFAKL